MRNTILLSTLLLMNCPAVAANETNTAHEKDSINLKGKPAERINIVVSSRTKKIDPALMSFQLQAWMKRLFRKKKFYLIIAGSAEEMALKAKRILKHKKNMIGHLWFDSHGHYGKRYSLFEVGKDEFSFKNIKDTSYTKRLGMIASYCDSLTKVGIGSCYSGATFTVPAIDSFPETRMNGDSLMMGLSMILNNATVYGSESWVMSGPGIFRARYALSGFPKRKRFKDPFFKPVWERLGEWNCYNGSKREFKKTNTVCLSADANIWIKDKSYLNFWRNQKKQQKKMGRLKKGNYNLAFLQKYSQQNVIQ